MIARALALAGAVAGTLALAGSGCAAIRNMPAHEQPEQRAVISRAEIESSTAADALQLIRAARPRWLNYRGPRSILADSDVQVYLNGIHLGSDAQLRGLSLDGVFEIEFLDAPSATLRWGTGHPRGAIIIHTERRRDSGRR